MERMPRSWTRRENSFPYALSRSLIMNLGAVFQGKALIVCWPSQKAVGTKDPRKSRIKPSMLRGYGARMSQRRPVRGAQEPQSAEVRTPPFGHLMGFWRGTAGPPLRVGGADGGRS